MTHDRKQCQHGYRENPCSCDTPCDIRLVACRDVPECPAYGPADFTDSDLNLIMAMCKTANPWYPEREMYPAWHGLYLRAQGRLLDRASQATENQAYEDAPNHICDCGTVCTTKEGHDRLWCPKCDNIWYREN